jgi:hypothetical protein
MVETLHIESKKALKVTQQPEFSQTLTKHELLHFLKVETAYWFPAICSFEKVGTFCRYLSVQRKSKRFL